MIEVNNLTEYRVDKNILSTVAKKVLLGENRGTETISVALVGKEEIKKINKKFRQKNKPTDVLSFEIKQNNILGEIIICPDVVKENAKKYKVPVKSEMLKMLVHGILHLCGYDHERSEEEEKIMEEKQEKYLNKIK